MTKEQIMWNKIHKEHLGLRSEDNGTEIKNTGTSYAMDMGKQYVLGADLPSEWEGHLKETIKQMQSYQNYSSRYLLIVDNSTGNSTESEYSGTFPKSSTKAQRIIASAPLNKSINELVAWVKQQIENI